MRRRKKPVLALVTIATVMNAVIVTYAVTMMDAVTVTYTVTVIDEATVVDLVQSMKVS